MKKKTILITSVGSLVGQNILDSLENRRENIKIIGINSIAEVANNFRCDKSYLISKTENIDNYLDELTNIIEKEKPNLVIPGRDEEVVILSQLVKKMPKLNDHFLIGSEHFAHILDDKVKSYQFAKLHKLPFAPTVQSGLKTSIEDVRKLIDDYDYPLIAKPNKGNGSRGIWIVLNKSQLDKIIIEPNFAIQPLFGQWDDFTFETTFGLPFFWEIPETKLFAAQVIIDKNKKIKSIFGFISKMVGGKCERMDRCNDPLLIEVVTKYAEAAIVEGWRGPFNIQLKKDIKHGFQVIEMNGRFSGGTSGRFHFGFDELGMILNEWIGKGTVLQKKVNQEVNVVTKILSDFEIKQANVDTLKSEKVWVSSRP